MVETVMEEEGASNVGIRVSIQVWKTPFLLTQHILFHSVVHFELVIQMFADIIRRYCLFIFSIVGLCLNKDKKKQTPWSRNESKKGC